MRPSVVDVFQDKKGHYSMKNIKNKTVGVVGLGHLGSSIVDSFLSGGFPLENLQISCRGNHKTYLKAVNMGVDSCLTETEHLMKNADIIILAARPQDFKAIAENQVREDSLLISFMAALKLNTLKENLNCRVCRAMCSGPETISAGRGAAVLFPYMQEAAELIELAGIKRFRIREEDEVDAFTAGICVPPILMNIAVSEEERNKTLSEMEKRFPVYGELSEWIQQELVCGQNGDKSEFLKNVSTKGGISEAMITSLTNGGSFAASMELGIRRCAEIRSEICFETFMHSTSLRKI
jgi:pyrroline-5-carboxylate reductase